MQPTSIIGIKIDPLPTDPRALYLFHLNFPVTLQPKTTKNDLTWDERQWCTAQILGQVRVMLVNSTDPYSDKFSTYIASRIVDVAAVEPSAQQLASAKKVVQDAQCYTDGNLWGVGDPAGQPPPNYIPGMHSSISYFHTEAGYQYPPGNSKYSGPYPAFTSLASDGTKGPPKPY